MFFLLSIVSMISDGFATVNGPTHLACGLVMLTIMIAADHLAPRRPALTMVLVYAFEIVFYAFSIHISMLHAESPAVSAVAFLLVSPLLFCDRPCPFPGGKILGQGIRRAPLPCRTGEARGGPFGRWDSRLGRVSQSYFASTATVSTCLVWGNMSTGVRLASR